MEPEARACAKLSRAAPGFGFSRRRRITRNLPVPESIDRLLDYLVYGSGPSSELGAVLEAAESLLRGKDVRAANLVSSMLEKLQLLVSYPDNALTADEVERLLLRRSLKVWREIDALWVAVGQDLAGRPANLSVSDYLKLSNAQLRREFRATYRVMPYGLLVGVFDILRWETGYRYATTQENEEQAEATAEEASDTSEAARGVA